MKVADVRARAKVWVANEATDFPGFKGAYIVGSVNHRGDDEEHPATSDVDVKVVLDADPLPGNPGKFLYRGALLDVSFVPFKDLRNAEDVLGHYHLAAGLCTPSVIADPTGSLTELQRAVTAEYAREQWVERRCRHARDSVLRWIGGIQRAELYHDQVTCWLFATGAMAHVVLVAGLQNPTIRRRYQAVQQVLARYGYLDFHETLLTLMGCATLTRAQVEQHLDAVEEVFDVASRLIETPYRFAADISALGRPIAMVGGGVVPSP